MSDKLGQLLLKGWTMLSESCPMGCSVPLMENRRGQSPFKSVCVLCGKEFIKRVNAEGEIEFLRQLTPAEEEEEKKRSGQEEKEKVQPVETSKKPTPELAHEKDALHEVKDKDGHEDEALKLRRRVEERHAQRRLELERLQTERREQTRERFQQLQSEFADQIYNSSLIAPSSSSGAPTTPTNPTNRPSEAATLPTGTGIRTVIATQHERVVSQSLSTLYQKLEEATKALASLNPSSSLGRSSKLSSAIANYALAIQRLLEMDSYASSRC